MFITYQSVYFIVIVPSDCCIVHHFAIFAFLEYHLNQKGISNRSSTFFALSIKKTKRMDLTAFVARAVGVAIGHHSGSQLAAPLEDWTNLLFSILPSSTPTSTLVSALS